MEATNNLHSSSIDALLQRAHPNLQQHGHVIIHDLLSANEVEQVRGEYQRFASGVICATNYGIFRDQSGFPLVINRVDNVSDLLFDLARSSKLINLVESVLGSPIVPLHAEFFCKPPHSSIVSPPHQDQVFYDQHFSDELAAAVWIALSEVDLNAAPLEYAFPPISYLLPHKKSSSGDFDYELATARGGSFAAVPLRAGDAVIHHAFVVHRSAPNRATRPRLAVAFNYRTSEIRRSARAMERR